jgi:hypothetical protein
MKPIFPSLTIFYLYYVSYFVLIAISGSPVPDLTGFAETYCTGNVSIKDLNCIVAGLVTLRSVPFAAEF